MSMTVVKPVTVTASNMTNTIPEPDASVGEIEWAAGTYTLGTQRIKSSTHKLYQVVADPSTTDDPEVGVNKTPQTWIEVSGTNKYRMFDAIIGTQSTDASPGSISVDITPGRITNAVAAFNISAQSVNVTVTDPTAGEVYNTDVSLRDNSAVVDYYEYFFEPIVEKSEFVLTDLPAYPSATVTVTATSTGDVAIGELTVGQQIAIGEMQKDSGVNLLNFNTLERDSFGNFKRTTGRRTADRFNYVLKIPQSKYTYVKDQMRELSDVAAVWIGTPDEGDGTTVYGYYRDLDISLDAPQGSIYSANFQVEGLI